MAENQELSIEKVETSQPQVAAETKLPETAKSTEEKNIPSEEQDPNWKAFREGRKKDRLEREAAEKRAAEKQAEVEALKAAFEAAFARNQPAAAPSAQAYQNYYGVNQNEENEDEKLEKKLNEMIAKRDEQRRREEEEREQREFPIRLQKNFPDFSNVISQENLDYFEYHFPEIARPLQRLPDGYDKYADIYHAIKKLLPNHANARRDAVRADQNAQKPKSISTPTQTPSGEPVRSTWQEMEQRRAANWERMKRTMNSIG